MFWSQIAGAMRAQTATTIAGRLSQHDKGRQVVVERTEAIVHPGAERWQIAIEDVAAGVELEDGAMVVVGGPSGSDQRHLMHQVAHVGEPVADSHSILAALLESRLHRVKR